MFIFDVTQQLIDNNLTLNPQYRDLTYQLFTLIEQSFNWEFTSSNSKSKTKIPIKHFLSSLYHVYLSLLADIFKSFIRRADQTQVTALKPTPEFKEIFLNPNLITLLFKVMYISQTLIYMSILFHNFF